MYFVDAAEFVIDGIPVTVGISHYWELHSSRVKVLAKVAEELFGRYVHHDAVLDHVLYKHFRYGDSEAAWMRLYRSEAEWAYKYSHREGGYITSRQIARALRGIPRERQRIKLWKEERETWEQIRRARILLKAARAWLNHKPPEV